MDSQHKHFLLHAKVRWQSPGQVLSCLFEHCEETKIFLGKINSPLAAFLLDVVMQTSIFGQHI